MKKTFRIWFTLCLVLVIGLSAGCPRAVEQVEPRREIEIPAVSMDEAISIAMELADFKEAAELGEIAASLLRGVWTAVAINPLVEEPKYHPAVRVDSRTGEILGVDTVPDAVAREIKDEYQIRRVLYTYAKAYETRDLELLKTIIRLEPPGDGGILATAEYRFDRFSRMSFTFTEILISVRRYGPHCAQATICLWEHFRGNGTEWCKRAMIAMEDRGDGWQIWFWTWPRLMLMIPPPEYYPPDRYP